MRLSVHAVVNTMLAMSAAAGATVVYDAVFNNGINDIPDTVNGLLGGLVCITCPCAFVSNWAAVVIGLISCFVTKFSASTMVSQRGGSRQRIDAHAPADKIGPPFAPSLPSLPSLASLPLPHPLGFATLD